MQFIKSAAIISFAAFGMVSCVFLLLPFLRSHARTHSRCCHYRPTYYYLGLT